MATLFLFRDLYFLRFSQVLVKINKMPHVWTFVYFSCSASESLLVTEEFPLFERPCLQHDIRTLSMLPFPATCAARVLACALGTLNQMLQLNIPTEATVAKK